MPEEIDASVGKHKNGTTECYNVTKDQSTIIRLLNRIGRSDSGCREAPLPDHPLWGKCSPALYQAILTFQRRHGLSVDGHVDPRGATLRKLNGLATGNNFASGISFAATSLSWIDPMRLFERGVIETDFGSPPSALTKSVAQNGRNCRFSNYIEGIILVEEGVIKTRVFGPDSGMYQRPSFRGTPSQSFPIRRQIFDLHDGVEFRQLVGCRTQAPELVGGGVGETLLSIFGDRMAASGRELGKALARFGPIFPPIWTELSLTVKKDGSHSSRVVCHSLFPSMTYYEGITETAFERVASEYYDGTASRFDDWFLHGWGAGNPWGFPFP
jgi:hypothetical protein